MSWSAGVYTQKAQPRWNPFRFVVAVDRDHPYGRAVWLDRRSGQTFCKLTDRMVRRMHLSSEVRRLISPFEIERRRVSRQLRSRSAIVRKIRLRFEPARRNAQAMLAEAGERRLPQKEGLQEPGRLLDGTEVPSWDQGLATNVPSLPAAYFDDLP